MDPEYRSVGVGMLSLFTHTHTEKKESRARGNSLTLGKWKMWMHGARLLPRLQPHHQTCEFRRFHGSKFRFQSLTLCSSEESVACSFHGGRKPSSDWIHSGCSGFQRRPRGRLQKMVSNRNVHQKPPDPSFDLTLIRGAERRLWS